MRKSWMWCLLPALAVVACGPNKVKTSAVDYFVEEPADSLAESSDSLEDFQEEALEEEPPRMADELFDDFVYDFARLKHMQRDRVKFPLLLVDSGDTSWIQRKEWRHEPLYLNQDYYTVFFNNERQMELEKRTDLEHVDVEWIFLHERKRRIFHFEREQGRWMLICEEYKSFEDNALLSGFFDFYSRFVSDTHFQQARVADPLRFVTVDPEDDFNIIEGTLDAEQWKMFKPELPCDTLTNVIYGQTYKQPNRLLLVKRGIANGMMDILTFKKGAEGWKLVSYEN